MPTVRKPPIGGDPAHVSPPAGESALAPRKLIRPALADVRRDMSGVRAAIGTRKAVPPEQTNAEAFYYLKQMQARTPIVVRLLDGEELRGWIEWYDKDVIKLNREGAPNLLVPKHSIKYLFKEEEERYHRRRVKRDERRKAEAPGFGKPDATDA